MRPWTATCVHAWYVEDMLETEEGCIESDFLYQLRPTMQRHISLQPESLPVMVAWWGMLMLYCSAQSCRLTSCMFADTTNLPSLIQCIMASVSGCSEPLGSATPAEPR